MPPPITLMVVCPRICRQFAVSFMQGDFLGTSSRVA